jgi:predicted acylesterase/phospholipase RssA
MLCEKFDTLILSGGGTKGIAQLGALHFFDEKNQLDELKEYYATSVGSIISLLLICGYSPVEIMNMIYYKNILKPEMLLSFSHIGELIRNYGILSLEPVMALLREYVIKKLGKVPTFLELAQITGKKLVITASNISKSRLEYFCSERTPNLDVVDGTEISSSLPFIFQKIKYKGDIYSDGGLGDNFPIDVIPDIEFKKILGITVSGVDKPLHGEQMGFFQYAYRIGIFPTNNMTFLRSKRSYDYPENVTLVTMILDDVPIFDSFLTRTSKMELFLRGYTLAKLETKKEKLMIDYWDDNDGWNNEFHWSDLDWMP